MGWLSFLKHKACSAPMNAAELRMWALQRAAEDFHRAMAAAIPDINYAAEGARILAAAIREGRFAECGIVAMGQGIDGVPTAAVFYRMEVAAREYADALHDLRRAVARAAMIENRKVS